MEKNEKDCLRDVVCLLEEEVVVMSLGGNELDLLHDITIWLTSVFDNLLRNCLFGDGLRFTM